MFMTEMTQPTDKISLNKALELRAKVLEQQCRKIKEYRNKLEQKKMFWRNREEQFRVQCFKIKKASENQENLKGLPVAMVSSSIQQERINQNTSKLLEKAQKFLKSDSTPPPLQKHPKN